MSALPRLPAPFRAFLRPWTYDTPLVRLRAVALAMRRLNHPGRLNSGLNHALPIIYGQPRTEDRNELERGNSASILAQDAELPCFRGRGDGCAALHVLFRRPFTLFHASFASGALNQYVVSLLTAGAAVCSYQTDRLPSRRYFPHHVSSDVITDCV